MNTIVSLIPDLTSHRRKLAQLGMWGVAFFALKGLAWLLVPLIALRLA